MLVRGPFGVIMETTIHTSTWSDIHMKPLNLSIIRLPEKKNPHEPPAWARLLFYLALATLMYFLLR
jgi:hypothetical protein